MHVHIHKHRYTHVYVDTHIYTYREAASYEATSVETSYSDNCYYRVTGLIRSIKCKGRRSKSYEYPCTIPIIVSYIYRGPMSACSLVCILRNCHCKIVLHEPENFDSHEIAMSLSRQTFRMKLLSEDGSKDDAWKRHRVSKEEGVATKSSQKRVKKLGRFKC